MDTITIERLAAAVHKAYCVEYERQNGESYWRDEEYCELDEATKEFDRATVKAVFKEYNEILSEEREALRNHPSYARFRNTKTEPKKG